MDNIFDFLKIFLLVAAIIALASILAVYTYGRFAKQARGEPSYALPLEENTTQIDQLVQKIAHERNGLGVSYNALSLLINNLDAFAARVLAARMAERSLDMMYYIWDDDVTGRLLLNEIVEAADRGVKVRLILDDINAQGRDRAYVALDQHQNIEIRMFNPSRTRQNGLQRGLEMALRALTVTRRMHNKAFIADGRLAFVGGRNIGDAYFGAGQKSNFRDLDLILIGPEVRNAESIFDTFWNSEVVLPIHALTLPRTLKNPDKWKGKLRLFRKSAKARPYLDYLHHHLGLHHFLEKNGRLIAADMVQVISDPPEKALNKGADNWLMEILMPFINEASTNLQITSPYFIPGVAGSEHLTKIAADGCDVQILTNSLSATDVAVVHGGYMCYRKKLLKGGVKLYELKADSGHHHLRLFGSGHASLHTKAFLIDRERGFVGSFNFDPRSASLNTEMGILFDCREIAIMMDQLFSEEINDDMSYEVMLDKKDHLNWHDIEDDRLEIYKHDPKTSIWRRLFVQFISWLPIESQL
ncbi:phospholipase D family protein [Bartonella sp. HY329]|uniref:phospholipase D family protein n=1 Tax=unclassified Bartonella TaxID=2645622 RepID=UPI0021C5A860|nr:MULTISPECIES: phospholipase D family protein [unclassified Bartonella]UXM95509.1 phospholipase D family protein [Bartonella sp. HY329]UXN09834.1 phospholipase D family protein [Bartonella sp. HY328]